MLISEKVGGISSIVRSSGTVTLTMFVGHSDFAIGDKIAVTGVEDNSFNGRFVVSSVDGHTLTYPQSGSGSSNGGWVRADRKILYAPGTKKIIRNCCSVGAYVFRIRGSPEQDGCYYSQKGMRGKCLTEPISPCGTGLLLPYEWQHSLSASAMTRLPNGYGIIAGSRDYNSDNGKFLKLMSGANLYKDITIARGIGTSPPGTIYEPWANEIAMQQGAGVKWIPGTSNRFVYVRQNSGVSAEERWELKVSVVEVNPNPTPPNPHYTVIWSDTIMVDHGGIYIPAPSTYSWVMPAAIGQTVTQGVTLSVTASSIKVFVFDQHNMGTTSTLTMHTYSFGGSHSAEVLGELITYGWAGADWEDNIWTYYGPPDEESYWRLYKNGVQFFAPGRYIQHLSIFSKVLYMNYYHLASESMVLRAYSASDPSTPLWTNYYWDIEDDLGTTRGTCGDLLVVKRLDEGQDYVYILHADNGSVRCGYGPYDYMPKWITVDGVPIHIIVTNLKLDVVECDPPEEGKKRIKIRAAIKGTLYNFLQGKVQNLEPIADINVPYSFSGAISGSGSMITNTQGIAEAYTICTDAAGAVHFEILQMSAEGYYHDVDKNIITEAEITL